MGLGKLGNGEKVGGVSAILLFVFMFFDWFGVESSVDSFGFVNVDRNAWEALDYIPIILLITIVTTLVVVALCLTTSVAKLPPSFNAIIAGLGTVSVVVILFRIIDPPTFESFETTFETVSAEGTDKVGIFLALLAAAGIAFGGLWGMCEGKLWIGRDG